MRTATALPALFMLALSSPAYAGKPNVTGAGSVTPAEVRAGTAAQFTAEMCNEGSSFVGGTAFLGTYIPAGVTYRIVSRPRRSACHAVLSSSYTYVYCTVSLRPGACDAVAMDVTPLTPGDYTLYVLADPGNVLRESDENDNRGSAALSAR